jgi:hypothetical protein
MADFVSGLVKSTATERSRAATSDKDFAARDFEREHAFTLRRLKIAPDYLVYQKLFDPA